MVTIDLLLQELLITFIVKGIVGVEGLTKPHMES